MRRIDDVHADVILDDLRHQAIHRAACRDDEVKDIGATLFFFDRSFERFDLATNASHPVQELGFLFDCM
ncbi:MAG TPA: hypothetical protein VIX59_08610 [Candidatus Binataceae bacterium]